MDDQKPLLRNPGIFPADEELRIVFGKEVFRKYKELMNTLTDDQFGLKPEWNYYKDGKAWLCNSFIRRKPYFGFPFGRIPLKLFFILPKKRVQGFLNWI